MVLDPSDRTLSAERASQAAGERLSSAGTPILDQGILMVQPVKSKAECGGGGGEGGGGKKSSGAVNQTAKGYLELGGKGGEGEAQASQEAVEEEEDKDCDEVEELINFSDSEGSLRSEFLE